MSSASGNLLSGLVIQFFKDYKLYVSSLFCIIISVNLRQFAQVPHPFIELFENVMFGM